MITTIKKILDEYIFYLHIKKAGGTSFRQTFSPPYVQTDRSKKYKTFNSLPKEEWNDALNNYRISLGEYDYKERCLQKPYSAENLILLIKLLLLEIHMIEL